jgi:NAD(P)H-dependent flavin oxidoreductase YrpB (nitropropane dioxygenase family)
MKDLLPEVLEAVDIPVVAAGGVVTGADIHEVLSMGADGVQMGSRFAATTESSAPEDFKQMYVDATPDDVLLIDSPVGLQGRGLRSPFTSRLEAGEEVGIRTCETCLRRCNQSFCIRDRLLWTTEGNLEEGLIFAGSAAARVHDIPDTSEVMGRLEHEYDEATEAAAS